MVSRDEIDPDVLVFVFDAMGSLTVKTEASTGPFLTGPEQLRRRLAAMRNCLMMLATKHSNHEELQDINKEMFDGYTGYLLGNFVWGITAIDLQGRQIQIPPWSLALSYEQAEGL